MGLSLKRINGRIHPFLTCDGCDRAIEDVSKALVTPSADNSEEGLFPVKIYHKGRKEEGRGCDPNVHGWIDLKKYMAWLLWNHRLGEINWRKNTVTLKVPEQVPEQVF